MMKKMKMIRMKNFLMNFRMTSMKNLKKKILIMRNEIKKRIIQRKKKFTRLMKLIKNRKMKNRIM
jgi:hypothetical protein